MNEMSTPNQERRPSTALYHSDEIGDLVAALATASASMTNPTKNREVEVYMRKSGGSYTFSYATFDSVLNIIRQPLAENGLVFTQLIVGRQLISLLAHKSGQWLKAVSDIAYDGGLQDMGSAISYLRRYAALAMFSLAAEDDDDGVGASSDREIVTREEAEARRREIEARKRRQEEASATIHPIQEIARLVKDQAGGVELLSAWSREAAEIEPLRADPDWPALLADVASALIRAFGRTFALAWKSAVMARKPGDMAAIQTSWDGAWKADIDAIASDNPDGHRLLIAHMREQHRRVTGAPPAPPAAPPAPAAPKAAPAPKPIEQAAQADHPAGEGLFGYHVRDHDGEAVSDLVTDPAEWARIYIATYDLTDPQNIEALIAANTDAITDALASGEGDPGHLAEMAAHIRKAEPPQEQAAAEPPAQPQSGIPVNEATGKRDYISYVRQVGQTLAHMNLAEVISWERQNRDTIESLPAAAKASVLQAITQRKQTIGK